MNNNDVFSELQSQESQELAAANQHYWSAVGRLGAEDADQQLTHKQMDELRADLRTLGTTAEQMRLDVAVLRELRAAAADDSDPVTVALERHRKAKERADKADAALAKAKAKLAAAEQEAQNASWAMTGAGDAIDAARRLKRDVARRTQEKASGLLARGMPSELLPPLPGQEEAPRPSIKHRVLQRTFHHDAIREPGEVVLLHQEVRSDVLRPLAEGEAEEPAPPKWRLRVLRNHRDVDGKSRMAGDVYDTAHDPTGNPFVAVVGDDVPLRLGDGETQGHEEESEKQEQEVTQ